MRVLTDQVGHVPSQDRDPGDHRSVAVVGAGISGLVAAYDLRRRGVNVTLYESEAHAGGAIHTTQDRGFLAEHGPNSFMSSGPVDALIAQLDLQRDVVVANPGASKRYVVRNGALLPFPMSPPALLTSPLFSLRGKLRALLEPLVSAKSTQPDESVAAFVRRRLGREVLDYAVDPFVSGVYAGDPEALSMTHAFPRAAALEREFGSLVKGLQSRRKAGAPRARLISFSGGIHTLTSALAASLGGTLRLGCPVRLVHRNEARWVVDAGPDGGSRTRTVDAVVMATPAHVLAAMELPAALRRFAMPVEQVEYPPLSVLTLGFRRDDVGHPLDGFGMLVPSIERRSLLGALFSSSLFPDRAPDGHCTITCFVGGARHPANARDGTDTLVERVMHDLRDLLAVRGEPVFTKHVFWPRAIPQYNVGYGAVKDSADAMELANPGFYLAGNYRHGVSVADCVASGQQVAERVAAYLTRAG